MAEGLADGEQELCHWMVKGTEVPLPSPSCQIMGKTWGCKKAKSSLGVAPRTLSMWFLG